MNNCQSLIQIIAFVCFLNLTMCLQLAFAEEIERNHLYKFIEDETVLVREGNPFDQVKKVVNTSDDESTILHKFVFEPTVGTWYFSGEESNSYGAFGELTTWRESTAKGSAWSPGIELFTVVSHGESKISAYRWDENTFGGGPALKYISPKKLSLGSGP